MLSTVFFYQFPKLVLVSKKQKTKTKTKTCLHFTLLCYIGSYGTFSKALEKTWSVCTKIVLIQKIFQKKKFRREVFALYVLIHPLSKLGGAIRPIPYEFYSIANKSSNFDKATPTNQCERVPDLWRPRSLKSKDTDANNVRLIPTAKGGKEINKMKWKQVQNNCPIFQFEKKTFYGD